MTFQAAWILTIEMRRLGARKAYELYGAYLAAQWNRDFILFLSKKSNDKSKMNDDYSVNEQSIRKVGIMYMNLL